MLGLWRIKHGWGKARRERTRRRRHAQATRAIRRFPATPAQRESGLPETLIVSLTSYRARFGVLAPTLKSLIDQTIRPDHLILWIAEADVAHLPADVRALEPYGLEVRGCRDLRSFKKLVPCLKAFPDAFIATFDDDTYYPPDLLERLVAEHDPARPAVIAARAHLVRFATDRSARAYRDWDFDTAATSVDTTDSAIFPTGVGGVLYPPGSLAPEVLDEDAFLTLCPHGDDLWFFLMQRRAGFSQRRAPGTFPIVSWEGSQESGLFLENIAGGGNDVQIRALEARYGRFGLPPGAPLANMAE